MLNALWQEGLQTKQKLNRPIINITVGVSQIDWRKMNPT